MKRLTVFVMAIFTVAVLSLPAFAASDTVLQVPALWPGDGSGVFASNQTSDEHIASNQTSDEHYGLAPAWTDNGAKAPEMRLGNPSLEWINDNVGQ